MDPNQGLNIENSKISSVNSIKTDKKAFEKKGLLKGSEILDKTKDIGDAEKIKKINSERLSGDNAQSTSEYEHYKLDNRIEPSLSDSKEKDKIREIKLKNPILNEGTNASLSKTNRMQNKTAVIKEKCIIYIMNPDKQIEDILEYIDSSYKNHPLKSTYDFAKQLVEIEDLRNISEDMQKEIEEITKKKEFFLILTNLHKFNMFQKEVKKNVENDQYAFSPLIIAQIADIANVLLEDISNDNSFLLDRVESQVDRTSFLHDIKNKPLSNFISKIPAGYNLNEDPHFYPYYKHFYPIILCGDLAIYTFEAEIYAYANNLFFLGIGSSERGVHGGAYKTSAEVFYHDIMHHCNMLPIDSPIQAIYLQQLSKALLEIIQFTIPENLKFSFYFASHLLLHEGLFPKMEEIFGNKNPNLTSVFNLIFGKFLEDIFRREFALKPVGDFTKEYLKNLEFDDTELKVTDLRPQSYDLVEAILFVTEDAKKKEELQNKILPNFSTAAKSMMKDYRNKHHITDETDRNSEVFNAYKKDYNNQLYIYKTQNYDQIEAYKAIKKLLINFKEKIIPHLEEIDKKSGPIDTSQYKNVWEKGQEINKNIIL